MNAISPEIVLALLMVCMIGEAVLAALYLSTRSLSIPECLGWCLVIVLVPLLGPFLAIAIRPGQALQSTRGGRAASHRRP
jgi:hypothetical protein